jgi:hypothetical protein
VWNLSGTGREVWLTEQSFEFMHRTELGFQALHDRIAWLEERQACHAPSDEQVERVLRKILAEKFAGEHKQPVQDPNVMKEKAYFVEDRKKLASLRPIVIDPTSLFVEPDAVPSKAYAETFKMLERRLEDFPNVDRKPTPPDTVDLEASHGSGGSRGSNCS